MQRARLVACDHSHGIFTLPHDLNPRWLANVAWMPPLLLQAVRDTLVTLLAALTSLGAPPGRLWALHPWSQPLVLPPHAAVARGAPLCCSAWGRPGGERERSGVWRRC